MENEGNGRLTEYLARLSPVGKMAVWSIFWGVLKDIVKGQSMKTLILYASTFGAAAQAACFLNDRLGLCDVVDLKTDPAPDLTPYDAVILGGSIRLGRIQKEVRKLAEVRLGELGTKRIGLYVCCMNEGEKARMHFDDAFPQVLRDAAAATGFFGGILDFSKMTLVERTIIQQVAGVTQSVSLLDKSSMERFAKKMRGTL